MTTTALNVIVTIPYKNGLLRFEDKNLSRWESLEILHVARDRLGDAGNYKFNLGIWTPRIGIIQSQRLIEKSEKNRIWNVCGSLLLSALQVSLIALAILFEMPLLAVASVLISYKRYVEASEALGNPWFCADFNTFNGKFLLLSGIWPALMGMVAPVIESYTEPTRLRETLQFHIDQFSEKLPAACAFYKAHGEEIAKRLAAHAKASPEPKENPPNSALGKSYSWRKAYTGLVSLLDLLRQVDRDIPKIEKLP